jgi:hypothetical protein
VIILMISPMYLTKRMIHKEAIWFEGIVQFLNCNPFNIFASHLN